MEKKQKVIKRIACLLCSAVVLLLSICALSTQADAVIGGYRYPPQYFPLARFDFCYAVNSAGSRYYLEWPLNQFAAPGYNYESSYEFTSGWFSLGGRTSMQSDNANANYPYKANSTLSTNVNWADGTGRSFNLFAYEMPWLEEWQGDVEYLVSFGNGGYMFDCDISFDLVFVTTVERDGNTYYKTSTVSNVHETYSAELSDDVVPNSERYAIDLAWYITEMYSNAIPQNPTTTYEALPYLKNVNIKFYNITADPDLSASASSTIYVSAHTYRYVDFSEGNIPYALNMQEWFDSLSLQHEDVTVEGSTIIYDMPTNWVQWLGTTIGNVLNIKLFGNFSLGGMLATVIGILIFMFFIKVFKG